MLRDYSLTPRMVSHLTIREMRLLRQDYQAQMKREERRGALS